MTAQIIHLPVVNNRTGESPTLADLMKWQRAGGRCRLCQTPLENELCPECDEVTE